MLFLLSHDLSAERAELLAELAVEAAHDAWLESWAVTQQAEQTGADSQG